MIRDLLWFLRHYPAELIARLLSYGPRGRVPRERLTTFRTRQINAVWYRGGRR